MWPYPEEQGIPTPTQRDILAVLGDAVVEYGQLDGEPYPLFLAILSGYSAVVPRFAPERLPRSDGALPGLQARDPNLGRPRTLYAPWPYPRETRPLIPHNEKCPTPTSSTGRWGWLIEMLGRENADRIGRMGGAVFLTPRQTFLLDAVRGLVTEYAWGGCPTALLTHVVHVYSQVVPPPPVEVVDFNVTDGRISLVGMHPDQHARPGYRLGWTGVRCDVCSVSTLKPEWQDQACGEFNLGDRWRIEPNPPFVPSLNTDADDAPPRSGGRRALRACICPRSSEVEHPE